jgi:hypothetical protein
MDAAQGTVSVHKELSDHSDGGSWAASRLVVGNDDDSVRLDLKKR